MKINLKLNLIIVGFVLFSLAVITSIVNEAVDRSFRGELFKRGKTIANNLTLYLANPLLTNDILGVEGIIKKIKQAEPDIEYIFVIDLERRVIAHTFSQGFPQDLLTANIIPAQRFINVKLLATEKGFIQDIAAEIIPHLGGEVRLGLSERVISGAINDILKTVYLSSFFILLISIMATLFVGRSISGSIKALHRGTEIIEGGNLDYRIGLNSKDEIGQLSRAFDQMAAKLKESYGALEKKVAERTEDLEKARAGLEVKVGERTRELREAKERLDKEVAQATVDLRARNEELDRVNQVFIGRELQMAEMKKEISELKKRLQ